MNGMIVYELAQLAEQDHMRNSLMAQERRAARRRQWLGRLRDSLRSVVGLGSNRQARTTRESPIPPAILSPGIRREAR